MPIYIRSTEDQFQGVAGRVRPTMSTFSTDFDGASTPEVDIDGSLSRSLGKFGAEFLGGIRWHPGHYMLVNAPNDTVNTAHLDQLVASGNIVGVQIRPTWWALEPTRDNYDMSQIQDWYDACEARGLFLIVQFLSVRFGSNWSETLPAYLDTDFTPSGIFSGLNNNGGNRALARIYNEEIMDRKILLLNQIATSFNSKRFFEGLVIGETSLGISNTDSEYTSAKFLTQLQRLTAQTRSNFSSANYWLYTNYFQEANDAQWDTLFADLESNDAGGGGPDAIVNNVQAEFTTGDNYFNGIPSGSINYRSVIPYNLSVQPPELGGKEGTWYPAGLAYSAITLKGATHMNWIRANYTTVTWDADIYPYLAGNPLETVQTRPTTY